MSCHKATEALAAVSKRQLTRPLFRFLARLDKIELIDLRQELKKRALRHDLTPRPCSARSIARAPPGSLKLPQILRSQRPDKDLVRRVAANILVGSQRPLQVSAPLSLPLRFRAETNQVGHMLQDERRPENRCPLTRRRHNELS